jgi:D-glycero-alpha-D-manno-heptose 1-phosphate guanylyltransferase
MIKEAIILAGGRGTRLQTVVSDLPKSLALVNGKPFLHYLFVYLKKYGIEKIILSTGYLSEKVKAQFGEEYLGVNVLYSNEETPLGTGGGIRMAMEKCSSGHVLAMNGDSIFQIELDKFFEKHLSGSADATLALRKVVDASRYGTIELEANRIISFKEKAITTSGAALINGGIYLLRKKTFMAITDPKMPFSIENDFFARNSANLWLQAFHSDNYFIDIGIPEDFERAQTELKQFQ